MRLTGGLYGIGCKLSVIFSQKFELQVWDSKRKLYYYQIYENNLSKISKPIIKKYNIIEDDDLKIDSKYNVLPSFVILSSLNHKINFF